MNCKKKMEKELKDCIRPFDEVLISIVSEKRAKEIGDEFKKVFECGFRAGFQRGYSTHKEVTEELKKE
ncbi:hypothetical protein ES705_09368 [subsurface metagenome]